MSSPERVNLEGVDAAEERLTMLMNIEMAKSRDKLFFEEQITEEDLDRTIESLQLNEDPDY